jgi:hypothetical protein
MAVAQADILARWPKLAQVTDSAEWTAAIADAALLVPAAVWGTLTDLATIHLAAHQLFVMRPDLTPRQVQSESVGGVSRSYVVASPGSGGGYQGTDAGQAYLRLRATLALGISVTS